MCCKMNVTEETVQTMRPQLISHGLPAIDTLNENSGICSPATSNIRRTYNTTHERASENSLGQVTSFGAEVVYYREENYKTYFEISHKNSKLQNDCKNIELSDHFWIQILLVQKRQMQKQQQLTIQHVNKNCMYQRNSIQTQICQTHR